MPNAPKPAADMSAHEYRDFVDEMHAAVFEEAPLHQVPLGGIDNSPDGRLRHGPRRAADCAWILSRWHDDGLLALYRYTEDGANEPYLSDAEALRSFREAARWAATGTPGGVVALCATERGAATPLDEWVSRLGPQSH